MIKRTVIGVCGLFLVLVFSSPVSANQSIGYQYYFKKGVQAFKQHDDPKALRCFKIAQIYDPKDVKVNQYINILIQRGVMMETYASAGVQVSEALPSVESQSPVPQSTAPPTAVQESPAPISTGPLSSTSSATPKSVIYVTAQEPQKAPQVLSLSAMTSAGVSKPTLRIELNSSVILEGKDVQRFLVVDEGFIDVKIADTDHLVIKALRVGSTFIHVWDASGRHTFYVEIVFPKTVSAATLEALHSVQHSQPFSFTYSNDWSTYYSGNNISVLKRQSYDFNQSLSMTGETPYGMLDASGSYSDFNGFSELDNYTVGLSQIPLEGTSNFNLRGLDALRYLSPLTMPGTRLRGVFADVDLLDDHLGLSVSHGQEQVPLGFFSTGGKQFNNSYIDAAKLTLFPKSKTDQYSFNFATAYGQDRQTYLSSHVYSIEGHHKFNDYLALNAEEANDSSHDSTLASLRWDSGSIRTGLNFRNIDKDYTAISTLPANQGETGASWTADADFKNISVSSFVETYRDRLNFNPDDPTALNYDANEHVKANFTEDFWSDTDLNYVDTPGELSPRRSLGLNERLSKGFGVWNGLKGSVFAGVGYQNSHSSDSNISDYDREDVIAGIQLPLTSHVSVFANDEYDWLNQPNSGGRSNPDIINAGIEYSKQFNPKFSVNSQLVYRDELGVQANSNSFLSGQRIVIITSGFAYNPTADLSFFADGDVSKVTSHVGQQGYDDFEIHLGVRITFGGASYWDPLGTVTGIVFKDKMGSGKFVTGDEGIAGVKLKVGDKEVVTDKNGRYSIQMRAKGVLVVPQLDTIPGGFIFSSPQSLDVDIIQGRSSHADFALISQTGIYGIVFVDKNGSRIPNDNDKFIGKVKVILDGKTIQRSDTHGAFYFRQVAPGEHTISIDLNTLAINMVPLVKLKNKIDVAEGVNYMFNIPVQIKKAEGDEE
jgi:hypothetical protein